MVEAEVLEVVEGEWVIAVVVVAAAAAKGAACELVVKTLKPNLL